MIDPRLTWFAIGASCSAVVFGWPWQPRFSRRVGPPRGGWRVTRSITFPDPHPDRQPTNPYTGGRVVDIHGRTIGRIPRSQDGTSNPPPTAP